jgi:hypothetical protein
MPSTFMFHHQQNTVKTYTICPADTATNPNLS